MSIFSFAANAFLKSKIGGICQINDFNINSREIAVSITLEGEKLPISIYASEFKIVDDHIIITRGGSDTPWVNNAIQKFVIGRRFPLPAGMSFLA